MFPAKLWPINKQSKCIELVFEWTTSTACQMIVSNATRTPDLNRNHLSTTTVYQAYNQLYITVISMHCCKSQLHADSDTMTQVPCAASLTSVSWQQLVYTFSIILKLRQQLQQLTVCRTNKMNEKSRKFLIPTVLWKPCDVDWIIQTLHVNQCSMYKDKWSNVIYWHWAAGRRCLHDH